MHRTFRTVVALLLGVLMALSLVACQSDPEPVEQPESAATLWEKIDQAMNNLESLELTVTTDKTYYHLGHEYQYSGTSYILSTKQTHYSRSTTLTTCPELELDETLEVVEAYYEGKMYRAIKDSKHDQKFCSEMSHEDYDGPHSEELTDGIVLTGCTNSAYSREGDGWKLTYSGYTKKAIDTTVASLGMESESGAIEDMQVVITVDADFFVRELNIDFVYGAVAGEAKPSFAVKVVYSNFNTATFDPALLNPDEYTQIEDIRILEAISVAMAQHQSAQIGQFVLTIDTKEEYRGQTRSSHELGTMIYGWKNGSYCYSFSANTDGKNFVVKFQGNEQTVVSGDQTYTVDMSEVEAKAYVDSLIDSAKYDPLAVDGVEKVEEGVYLLTFDSPDVSAYMDGIEITEADQQIRVTFNDGKIEKILSTLSFVGAYDDEPIEMTTESAILFMEITEFPEM